MENYKLSKDYCENIIKVFSENETMQTFVTKNRSYKRFLINEHSEQRVKYEWFWNDIHNLIQNVVGNNYYLTIWIIVLKYEKGDYFANHQDSPSQNDDRCLSGGVELSDKNNFEGAEFILKNKPIKFERGKLLTHKVLDTHEITKCEKGTRWSLHFGINKDYNKKLI